MIITGHRGAAGLAPENTLAAINLAIEYKTDRIEIDVEQSADGVVMVMHDRKINRTTNGIGFLHQLNYGELRKFSAGRKFSKEFEKEKIPSLEEVLQLINGRRILLIEIKDGSKIYPNIEQNVIKLIQKHKAEKWCILQSFNDNALFTAHKIAPQLTYHKLFTFDCPLLPFFFDEKLNFNKFQKYHFVSEFSFDINFANKRIVRKIHSLGKKANVWTVRSLKQKEKADKLNLDGIITDFPNFYKQKN